MVPRTPSVFCAVGGLVSDLMHDSVRTVHGLELDGPALRQIFEGLASEARSWLAAQADPRWLSGTDVEYYAEINYAGQSFQVDVALDQGLVSDGDMAGIAEAFHAEHLRLYSHADPQAPIQFQQLRTRALSQMTKPEAIPLPGPSSDIDTALLENRRLRLQDVWHEDVPVYRRDLLGPGHRIAGPAIIEQGDACNIFLVLQLRFQDACPLKSFKKCFYRSIRQPHDLQDPTEHTNFKQVFLLRFLHRRDPLSDDHDLPFS